MPWPAALAIAAMASVARASPADDPATDGAVFAGVTGADPANATANPATLLRLVPGWHVFAISTTAYDRVGIARGEVDPDSGAITPAGRVADATVGAGATAGVALVRPNSFFATAVSLRPPDETIDDPAVIDHTRGSRARGLDVATIAIGYRLASRVYLGLSITYTDRHAVLRYGRDTAIEAGHDPARGVGSDCGGAPCGIANPAARELWRIDVGTPQFSFDNVTYAAGVLLRLPGNVWLGLATARPWQLGRVSLTGDVEVTRAPRDGGATLVGQALLYQHLPEVIRFGGRGPIARGLELNGELRMRRLARAASMDVRVFGNQLAGTGLPEIQVRPTGVTDTVAVEVGVEQPDRGQRWRGGARLGFDTGAVLDERISARAPWGRQLTAALGAQLRVERWTLQLGYRFDWQLPITAGGGDYDPLAMITCADAAYDYDLPACASVRAGYATSTAAGDYTRQSHTLRVALGFVLP